MKKKLLIVDDQDVFTAAINRAILSSAVGNFVEVISAKNAAEGMALFKKDLEIIFLVADVHMPGVSGIEMVRQMKEYHPERFQAIESFMVCANRDRDEYKTCLELGIDHWLIKPLRTDTLCQYILQRVPKYLHHSWKKKLLVVDDQALFRASINRAISSSAANEFVEVISAESAAEGIALFKKELGISVVIADVHMPGGDGIDMMRQIKEQHPERFQQVEIFMACANKDPTEYQACLELGIDRWLIKPLRTEIVCRYLATKGREWSTQRGPTHVLPTDMPALSM